MSLNVDSLIQRLLNVGSPGGRLTTNVDDKELVALCGAAQKVFASQPSLVEIVPPVVICGDIHGQYSDLLRVFALNGFPPKANYIFLGDYIDRGRQSIETIALLFCFKIKWPENLFMLRGNHECAAINRVYGFQGEVQRRYPNSTLWSAFQNAFNWMPLTGLIAGRILCMHGGLSPMLQSLDDLRNLPRPQDPQSPSLGIDLLWSDPEQWVKGWQQNTRGVSYVFGQDVVAEVCQRLGLDLVVRAHQVVQDGYEFFANRRMVTLFTAPHYCAQFDNASATMRVTEDLTCIFTTYRPKDSPSKTSLPSRVLA